MDLTADGTSQTAWDPWMENMYKSWALKTVTACFFNYKGTYSVVFFTLVDANYHMICADVGCQGHISDGEVFTHTIRCITQEKN